MYVCTQIKFLDATANCRSAIIMDQVMPSIGAEAVIARTARKLKIKPI